MVFRKGYQSGWSTKISSFFIVVFAGTLHRFENMGGKFFDLKYWEKISLDKSNFMPAGLREIFHHKQS
jgi:hypothetical protein